MDIFAIKDLFVSNIVFVAANSEYEAIGYINNVTDKDGNRKYYYELKQCIKVPNIHANSAIKTPKEIDIYELFKPLEEEEEKRINERMK